MDFQRAIKEMLLGVKIARINGNKIFYYQQFVKPDGTRELSGRYEDCKGVHLMSKDEPQFSLTDILANDWITDRDINPGTMFIDCKK